MCLAMCRSIVLPIVTALVVAHAELGPSKDDFAELGIDREGSSGETSCAVSLRQLRSGITPSPDLGIMLADTLAATDGAVGPQASPPVCSVSYKDNCMYNPVCCTSGHTCYAKDSELSLCMEKCVSGIHADDPPKYQTPWSCSVVTRAVHKTSYEGPLGQPSTGELLTFYMYYAQGGETQVLANVNAANLPGIMWYVQNTIASEKTTVAVGFSVIRRLRVQMRATQELLDQGMTFSSRVIYESGECMKPHCQYSWDSYGYTVGCNNLGEYPSPRADPHYPDGILYSLPGSGRCPSFIPTGEGDCTWNYEDAGQIELTELYEAADASEGAFWAKPDSDVANKRKLKIARDLFESKYGKDSPAPPCDFNLKKFYR